MNIPGVNLGFEQAANVERLSGLSIPANPAERDALQRRLAATWGAGDRAPWTQGQCKVCAVPNDAAPLRVDFGAAEGPLLFDAGCCPACHDLVQSHYHPWTRATDDNVSLTPLFDAQCDFRELLDSESFPPNFDRAAMQKALSLPRPSSKGLALVGDSGAGKTTTLWALFRQIERAGGNPKFLTGVELGRILGKAARDIEAIDWLAECRHLLIDDLGKERPTPGASALLWELLDRRYRKKLPLYFSTRFAGQALRDRFSEVELGTDIIRRLNELCAKVHFRVQGPAPA